MTLKLAALICVLTLTACVMTAPDHVAGKFCRLNDRKDDTAIKRILSTDLRTLWEQAQAKSDDWAKKNPGEKPPLGDGIHTQAYADFAAICRVENISGDDTRREATIYHGFPGDPQAGWSDRLVLIPEKGSWVIDEILFAPGYSSGLRYSLKSVLDPMADIAQFTERREMCEHFIGEEPYDEERRAYLNKTIDETCTGTDRELAALKAKYADNPEITAKLSAYDDKIEGF